MGLKEIKKELNQLDKKNLIDLLVDMYKKNTSVKEFLDFFIEPDENKLMSSFQKRIYLAFKVDDPYSRPLLKEAKKEISDFKRLEPTTEALAHLMLVYVECGVNYAREYVHISDSVLKSVSNMFDEALDLLDEEELIPNFIKRIDKIMFNAESTMFEMWFSEIYFTYCVDEEDYDFEELPTNTEPLQNLVHLVLQPKPTQEPTKPKTERVIQNQLRLLD